MSVTLDQLTRQRALALFAEQWVGLREDGINAGPLVERMQKVVDGKAGGEPWCVCFVQYCVQFVDDLFATLGATGGRHALPLTELATRLFSHTTKSQLARAPERGAIAVWSRIVDGKPSIYGHAGIVLDAFDAGVTTVEGNTSAPGGNQREGDGVHRKRRERGQIPGFILLGYVRPWL